MFLCCLFKPNPQNFIFLGALKRKKKNLKCEECGVEIASRLLIQHVKVCFLFSCDRCEKTIFRYRQFAIHILNKKIHY